MQAVNGALRQATAPYPVEFASDADPAWETYHSIRRATQG